MSKTKTELEPIALDKRKIHLNSRLLIVLVAALLVVGIGSYFLHRHNMRKSSDGLLTRAMKAHEDGKTDEAVKLLTRYVDLKPSDTESALKLGEWLDDSTTTQRGALRAYQLLDRSLSLTDYQENEDLRRRVVRLAVKLGRFRDALQRLDDPCVKKQVELSDEFCNRDLELINIRARCAEELDEFERATTEYLRGIQVSEENEGPPSAGYTNVDFYVRLISLVSRRNERLEGLRKIESALTPESENEPDQEPSATAESVTALLLETMVRRSKPPARGLLARAIYRRDHNQLEGAASDIKAALDLEPTNNDALIQAIEVEMAQATAARLSGNAGKYTAHIKAANEFVVRARESAPDDLRLYLSLSRVTSDSNRLDEAEEHVREGLRRLAEILEKEPKKSPANIDLEYRLNWTLANVLIIEAFPSGGDVIEKKLTEAEEVIKHLQKLGIKPSVVNFLRARILMGRKEWKQAADMLANLRNELGDADIVRNADLSLASCYEKLGRPDDRLAALQRAVEADPYWVPTRVEYANALTAVGRTEDALATFRGLQQIPSIPTLTARILMQQQLRFPEGQRNWSGVEELVRRAEQVQPRTAESQVLRGELLFHQGKFDAAGEEFESAISRNPDLGALWGGLVGLQLRRSDLELSDRIERAEEVLKRAEAAVPKLVDVALLAADIALAKGPAALTEVLKALEARADELAAADRITLFRGLAVGWDRNGNPAETRRLLEQAANLAPDDLVLQLALAEWAIRENDDEALTSALDRVRKVEGPNGPNGDFVEAQSLLVKMQKLKQSERDKAVLDRAWQLLENAGRLRRSWSAVPRALGTLELQRGNRAEANVHFQRALEMGDRSRETVLQVFSAMLQEKRYDDILSETRRIAAETPSAISGDVGRIVTLAAYEGRQFRDALEYSKKLGANSADYRDHVLRGQLLSTGDAASRVEAEMHFRKAVELAPAVPQVWGFLVGFLFHNKRLEEAKAVIQEASEKVPADPPYLKSQTLAACYDIIGERKEAERNYLAAQAAAPDNLGLVNDTMIFYLRGREIEKADAEIDKILDPAKKADKPMLDAARRTHALIAANRGGTYDDIQKSIRMIEVQHEKDGGQVSVADLRAKAILLTRSQFRRDRLRLIECLEEIEKQGQLTTGERFQLAQLCDLMDRPADAQKLYAQLLDADSSNISVLIASAQSRLRTKDLPEETLNEVIRLVAQVERKEPRSFRTTLLKAGLLETQGKVAEVTPLLRQFLNELKSYRPEELFRDLIKQQKTGEALALLTQIAGKRDDQSIKIIVDQARKLLNGGEEQEALTILQRYVAVTEVVDGMETEIVHQVAVILEGIGQIGPAEEVYKQYVSRAKASRSDATLVYAAFLARQKRIDEALAQCREASQEAPTPRMISVSLGVLRAGLPNSEQIAAVEKQVLSALEQASGPDAVALSISLADLRDLQGRYDETIAIYRSILDKDSNNIIALNNLSWMLSFMPTDRAVCLPLINRAIQLRGPVADLVDTRAVIYLNLNRPRDAVKDLKSAYEEVGSPSILFHLAQAQFRAGDPDTARDTFQRAEKAGFNPKTIHPLEKPGFDELTKGLVDNRRAKK